MIELNIAAKAHHGQGLLLSKEEFATLPFLIFHDEDEFKYCLDLYQWHARPFKVTKKKKGDFTVQFMDIKKGD